ncbi:Os03g0314450, partial [Oryza sativa Japonica Group]
MGVAVGGRGHGRVEREAQVRQPMLAGRLEDHVAGEGVGAVDDVEEAERVVEREREEAGGGGEEDEAAGGEGVGEETGRDELGVDLEEVARRAAPREVRVQEGHREH